MSELSELPPRPRPPRRATEAITAWVVWFGVARLVAAAVSVIVVVVGVAWLVRTGPPATEAGLPMAAASASTLASTPTLPTPAPAGAAVSTSPSEVVVHVAGEVARPGVYRLAPGGRVHDAIVAAGDLTAAGDPNGLNLAAPVVDGQRVYVPAVGEVDPAGVVDAPLPSTGAAAAGPLDLNRATAGDLETLPGIGPATAAAIVDDRERNGPFASVDDLDRVAGIGPAKLAAISDLVTV